MKLKIQCVNKVCCGQKVLFFAASLVFPFNPLIRCFFIFVDISRLLDKVVKLIERGDNHQPTK